MEVIAEENWSWMLFAEESRMFLSVLCGSSAMFDINLESSADEQRKYRASGDEFIRTLAADVRSNPAAFVDRSIKGFERLDGVSSAAAAWRSAHDRAP